MEAHGWEVVRAGWFIETTQPLTADQRAEARRLAARSGMTVEVRNHKRGLTVTRTAATAAGMFLALCILAMTLGLIRGEAARDLRTLTATGAPGRARRSITAVTAGALTFIAAVLGLVGSYAALIAGFSDDLSPLWPVPWRHLVLIVAGLPTLACVIAWLVSGREPVGVARQPLE
jgi:putative ABC transport system permease protein